MRDITPFALRKLGKSRAKVLDVGCGCTLEATRRYRPQWEVYGLDKVGDVDFKVDLDKEIPWCGLYDIIIMRHVIEHLKHPKESLEFIVTMLAPGGKIYLEYPSERSLYLPSMPGTLNFYDDPTHIYLPDTKDLSWLLKCRGLRVESGTRRDWLRILLSPIHIPLKFIYRGFRLRGSDFWDILGFADYILAEKLG